MNPNTTASNTLGTFESIMGYLHSIPISQRTKTSVSRQLRMEAIEEHRQQLEQRLSQIAALRKGWDGYVGAPVKAMTTRIFDAEGPSRYMEGNHQPYSATALHEVVSNINDLLSCV